ncbi:MAG TPA: SgcJ/EcaC family oxidoreductase [Flavitalea sp.]|nr:SgcJ/EcaC family oxidoreductase [Flavitalea sp.]
MEYTAIEELYNQLLTCWNNQDAAGMASLFTEDANVIGFDGTQMNGQSQIETDLKAVFTSHKTARYVWKIEEIRSLDRQTVLLRAIVGMVPPGKHELNPATNAIQSLVVNYKNNAWKISLFQNTPAQFHGRPEQVEAMTKQLSQLV